MTPLLEPQPNQTGDAFVPSRSGPPTTHRRLLSWVREVAELTQPDTIRWCDGSEAEWAELTSDLVDAGTLVQLDPQAKPNSFYARTDPSDVARVEDRTYICSVDPADAGPTNNWLDPAEMKSIMTELYRGSMRGRTMYVVSVLYGSARRRAAHVRGGDHRLRVRRDQYEDHDPDGRRAAGRDDRGPVTPTSYHVCTRSAPRSNPGRRMCRGRVATRNTSPTSPRSD